MDEIPASDAGELPAWHGWSTTELILDGIFRFLVPTDLKNARLVSRKWAICGSRPLIRKTFIRLSQVCSAALKCEKLLLPHFRDHFMDGKFSRQNEFRRLCQTTAGSDPESDLWESSNDLKPREYLTFNAYSNYMDSAVFPSEFEPRNFVLYTFSDVRSLKSLEFSCVEWLKVVFVQPCEAYALMSRAHRVFPTMKSLELGYIESDDEVIPEFIVNFVSKLEAMRTERPSIEKPKRLEELSFPFPANLHNLDWSFLARFANLKKLNIRWPGACSMIRLKRERTSIKGIHDRSYWDIDTFETWLEATSGYLSLCNLTDLSLRFQITETIAELVTTAVAASPNLKNLELQVYGQYCFVSLDLIYKLDIKTVHVLNSLYFCIESSEYDGHLPIAHIKYILELLNKKDFFLKPTWTLVFREAADAYWIHLEKHENQCIIQTKGTECGLLEDFPAAFLEEVPCVFQYYNYVYQFGTEELNPALRCYIYECVNCQIPAATSHYNAVPEMFSQSRRKPQKLLCEFPGFLQEAGLILGKRSNEQGFSTLAYSFVPLPVIAKWSEYLENEQLIHDFQQLQFQEAVYSQTLQSISARKQKLLELLRAKKDRDSSEELDLDLSWLKTSYNCDSV